MSWLRKAEELLNRVDQSAAQALQKNEQSGTSDFTMYAHKRNPSASFDNMDRFEKTSSGSSTPSNKRFTKSQLKPDALIDYLNSTDTKFGEETRSRATGTKYQSKTRQPEFTDGSRVKSGSASDSDPEFSRQARNGNEAYASLREGVGSASPYGTKSWLDGNELERNVPHSDSAMDDEMTQHSSDAEHRDQVTDASSSRSSKTSYSRVHALELENKLLKQEIEALNRECASIVERSRAAQSDRDAYRNELAKLRASTSSSERRVRELEAALGDANEALRAKDSQIGVLRVRLDDAEHQAHDARGAADSHRVESETVVRESEHATAIKDTAIESLSAQLRELETTLHNERSVHETALRDAAEANSRLEAERNTLTAQLGDVNRRVSEEHFRASELARQLVLSKHANDAIRDELSAYREKAQLLVSAKERTISQLAAALQQNGVTQLNDADANSVVSLSALGFAQANDEVVPISEFDKVRSERDSLREELRAARCAVDQLRADLQDAEMQSETERRSLQDTVASLEQQLATARARTTDAEAELRSTQRSVQAAQEELQKQTSQLRNRLSDREAEIERLRSQVLNQQRATSSTDMDTTGQTTELDARVRSLTESLIAKQTLVETLQTEKQTIRMQYERLNSRYTDLQRYANSRSNGRSHTSVTMFEDTSDVVPTPVPTFDYDDVVRRRLPLPAFIRESLARDTHITRNVRKAVTGLDVCSIRVGLLLRRYPIARLLLLCYVLLLHLWVFVVLTTYQHEIHIADEFKALPLPAAQGHQGLPAHKAGLVPGPLPPLPHG